MPKTSHPKATASQGLFASRMMFSRNSQLVRVSEISFKKSYIPDTAGSCSRIKVPCLIYDPEHSRIKRWTLRDDGS